MTHGGGRLWGLLESLRKRQFLLGFSLAAITLAVGPYLYLQWDMLRGGPVSHVRGMASAVRMLQELRQGSVLFHQYYATYGAWPENLAEVSGELDVFRSQIDSPQPLVLRATIAAGDSDAAGLAGRSLMLRLDPESWRWICDGRTNRPFPSSMLPESCLGATPAASENREADISALLWKSLLLPAVVVIGLSFLAGYLYLLLHPMVQSTARRGEIYRVPLADLPRIVRLLSWSNRLRPVLRREGLDADRLGEAVGFASLTPEEKCALLCRRLGGRCELPNREAPLASLILPEGFPLELNRMLLYCPDDRQAAGATVETLRGLQTDWHVCLIVAVTEERNAALLPYGEDASNLWVVPDLAALTALLLAPDPHRHLVRLLARQLRAVHVSPYQTRGGIARESQFFGRERILARVLSGEPANFLFIGGRQLGKSSLLKQIRRRAALYPDIRCHYLVLHDAQLMRGLRRLLGLPAQAAEERVFDRLAETRHGRRRLILVDEADRFMQAEMETGYPLLGRLRSLAEEGHCNFIFAGFWDLYVAAFLDYRSPLKNFGEAVTIGALEADACRELATKPMRLLGVSFADKGLVERIVDETGQRANLVAIACDDMLRQLDGGNRILDRDCVTSALRSRAIREDLAGWTRLTGDVSAARIDRILVYGNVKSGRFTLGSLIEQLRAWKVDFEAQQVIESLARLELAFVLRRAGSEYRFSVPLFRRLVLEQEPDVLLRAEIQSCTPTRRSS